MAEHVSVFRAKAKPRKRQQVVKHFEKWDREQKKNAKGFLRSEIVFGKDNPDEILGVVHFDNSRNYQTNARRPEQDQWHRELVELLESRPQWWDGQLAGEVKAGRARAGAAQAPARAGAARGGAERGGGARGGTARGGTARAGTTRGSGNSRSASGGARSSTRGRGSRR